MEQTDLGLISLIDLTKVKQPKSDQSGTGSKKKKSCWNSVVQYFPKTTKVMVTPSTMSFSIVLIIKRTED